jgi:hypothetical protein
MVDTQVELSGSATGNEAGLTIVGRESAALAIARASDGYAIVYRINGRKVVLQKAQTGAVRLRVGVSNGGECTFAFATVDADFKAAPETFQAQAGVWIGAKVGIYSTGASAVGGYADFDYFRFGRTGS